MLYRKSRALLAATVVSVGVLNAWNFASAAPVTWDGGGANDLFTTPLNWAADVTPAPLDSLTFAGATRLTPSNNFAAGTAFGGITFDASAGAFTIGGNALALPQF